MNFKLGDRVRMKDGNEYVHGEITVIKTNNHVIKNISDEEIICKVMFDEDWAPDYWYYPAKELELIYGEE